MLWPSPFVENEGLRGAQARGVGFTSVAVGLQPMAVNLRALCGERKTYGSTRGINAEIRPRLAPAQRVGGHAHQFSHRHLERDALQLAASILVQRSWGQDKRYWPH